MVSSKHFETFYKESIKDTVKSTFEVRKEIISDKLEKEINCIIELNKLSLSIHEYIKSKNINDKEAEKLIDNELKMADIIFLKGVHYSESTLSVLKGGLYIPANAMLRNLFENSLLMFMFSLPSVYNKDLKIKDLLGEEELTRAQTGAIRNTFGITGMIEYLFTEPLKEDVVMLYRKLCTHSQSNKEGTLIDVEVRNVEELIVNIKDKFSLLKDLNYFSIIAFINVFPTVFETEDLEFIEKSLSKHFEEIINFFPNKKRILSEIEIKPKFFL
jgi:hypothetical protein